MTPRTRWLLRLLLPLLSAAACGHDEVASPVSASGHATIACAPGALVNASPPGRLPTLDGCVGPRTEPNWP